jgi:hypothetical protein
MILWGTRSVDYVRARKPAGGFLFVRVRQLAMLWWAYRAKLIELKDVRFWFAAQELIARRCELEEGSKPHFTLEEIGRLISARGGERACLKRLEEVGFLKWSSSMIHFASSPEDLRVSDLSSLHAMLACIANNQRNIPLPRRVVRFLAQPCRRSVVAVILAHVMRCLYYRAGECVSGGFCKASWISEVFSVDLRNVKLARKFLERELSLLESHPIPQSLLNRYGQKVTINLAWDYAVDKSAPRESESPPPVDDVHTETPPPRQHKEPSLEEDKHQKPAVGGERTGILETRTESPTLANITAADLRETGRLLELFREATDKGLFSGSESERLVFVAAAERARLYGSKNPPGFFSQLISRRLFHFISSEDEERARKRLNNYLYGGGCQLMTPQEPPGGGPSKDALFVADVQRRLAQAGFSGNMFALVSRELPEWTRERWERASRELHERQAKPSLAGILGEGLRKTLGAICGGR